MSGMSVRVKRVLRSEKWETKWFEKTKFLTVTQFNPILIKIPLKKPSNSCPVLPPPSYHVHIPDLGNLLNSKKTSTTSRKRWHVGFYVKIHEESVWSPTATPIRYSSVPSTLLSTSTLLTTTTIPSIKNMPLSIFSYHLIQSVSIGTGFHQINYIAIWLSAQMNAHTSPLRYQTWTQDNWSLSSSITIAWWNPSPSALSIPTMPSSAELKPSSISGQMVGIFNHPICGKSHCLIQKSTTFLHAIKIQSARIMIGDDQFKSSPQMSYIAFACSIICR